MVLGFTTTYDDWLRQRGLNTQFGPAPPQGTVGGNMQTVNWGQVPGRMELSRPVGAAYADRPTEYNYPQNPGFLNPATAPQPWLTPAPPVVADPRASQPWLTDPASVQARTGTGQSGQEQVANAPVTNMPTRPLSALGQGAGQAQVVAGAPAWARFTAGNTGASYSNIAKTFDPWGDWGRWGPNQAKAPKRHQIGTRMESDIDRVYRWTNDILRTQYGVAGGEAADPALRTQIFLANVERLRNEYRQNNLDWGTSAFADMEGGEAYLRQQSGQQPGGTQPPATSQPGTSQPGTGNPAGAPQAPAPPTQGLPTGYKGQNAGAGGGGLTAAQRLALSDDPNQAYRYMMQQLGYNPSAPGLLGNFLKKRFQPLLEARMAASGVTDNSNYMDTIDQIINEFGGNLFQKGGNFFGNLRDVGTQAAQGARPYLDSLQDQNQAMQYMNQLGMLRYAGANPLVQQSVADEMQRGREGYQDEAFNRELAGQQLDPFTAWLMNSRYRNYFGF